MVERKDKRHIDRVRDSALSMQIGDPEDGAICAMVGMETELLIVLERAIYAVQLADQVDPERTNPAVPNTKQRVLSLGARDPAVGRILLTAHAMFKTTQLGTNFPNEKALSFAFDLLRDIAAMIEMHSAVVVAINGTTADTEAKSATDRSFQLPAMGDAKNRCDAFAQKVGHALKTMKEIALLFYPGKLSKKWVDSLIMLCSKTHGDDEPLTQFMRERRDSLLFMIELRNKIEHPHKDERVTVSDFRPTPDLKLIPPQVDIVASGQTSASQPLSSFMSDAIECLVSIDESFMALLCGAHIKSSPSFPVVICEIPPNRRTNSNPHQRLSYGVVMGDRVHLLH